MILVVISGIAGVIIGVMLARIISQNGYDQGKHETIQAVLTIIADKAERCGKPECVPYHEGLIETIKMRLLEDKTE